MRGENGELVRGRWRAGPSGHGVGGAHPWNAVRVENTAEMTRYPANGNGRVRVEQHAAAVMHGANDDAPQIKELNKKGKWWESVAWLCCGFTTDEGGMRMRTVRHSRARTEPLFVGATNTDVTA